MEGEEGVNWELGFTLITGMTGKMRLNFLDLGFENEKVYWELNC